MLLLNKYCEHTKLQTSLTDPTAKRHTVKALLIKMEGFPGKLDAFPVQILLLLSTGMHMYPFEFILPEDVPASMEWDQEKSNYKSFGYRGKCVRA